MHTDPDLAKALEPSQLSTAILKPYPRRKLGGITMALLVGLRIYILLAVPVVIYAFVHALITQ